MLKVDLAGSNLDNQDWASFKMLWHNSNFNKTLVSIPVPEWYFFIFIFFSHTWCFKAKLNNDKNTLQLQHKTFLDHFSGDSHPEFRILTGKSTLFYYHYILSTNTVFWFILIHLNEVEEPLKDLIFTPMETKAWKRLFFTALYSESQTAATLDFDTRLPNLTGWLSWRSEFGTERWFMFPHSMGYEHFHQWYKCTEVVPSLNLNSLILISHIYQCQSIFVIFKSWTFSFLIRSRPQLSVLKL